MEDFVMDTNEKRHYFNELLDNYDFQTELTKELDELNSQPIDEFILLKIILWKLNRYPDLKEFSYDRLNNIATLKPQEFKNVREFLNNILEIKGIGLPMASTILRFRNPDTFPIIDRRAFRVLMGENYVESSDHKRLIDRYFEYVEKCRQLSQKYDIPFDAIDRVLYQYDKKHNSDIPLYRKSNKTIETID
jgi:thermostable 8-oxoguanine DNA glycosylase